MLRPTLSSRAKAGKVLRLICKMEQGFNSVFSLRHNLLRTGAITNVSLEDLTPAGWFLTLMTVGGTVAAAYFYQDAWLSFFPPVKLPVIIFALPWIGIGLLVFALGAGVLSAIGVPVVNRNRDEGEPRQKTE
jgi:hypothetical protein